MTAGNITEIITEKSLTVFRKSGETGMRNEKPKIAARAAGLLSAKNPKIQYVRPVLINSISITPATPGPKN